MKFKRLLSALLCVLMLTSSFVFTVSAATLTTLHKPAVGSPNGFSPNAHGLNELKIGTYGGTEFLYSSLRYDSAISTQAPCFSVGLGDKAISDTVTFAFVVKLNTSFQAEEKVVLNIFNAKKNNVGLTIEGRQFEKVYTNQETGFSLWMYKIGPEINVADNYDATTSSASTQIRPYNVAVGTIQTYFGAHPDEPIFEYVGAGYYKNVDASITNEDIFADIMNKSVVNTDATNGNIYRVTYDMPDGYNDVVKDYLPSKYLYDTYNGYHLPVYKPASEFELIDPEIHGFLGWKKNGTGDSIPVGTSQTVGTGAVTYVADVIAGNFVTFDAGKGSFEGDRYEYVPMEIGDKVLENVPQVIPTYDGYKLQGWSLDPDADPIVFADENTQAGDHDFYKAVWVPIPGEEYVLDSVTIENSANDTINAKYVNTADILGNPDLTGFTVTLPYGWNENVMPTLKAESDNGIVTYTAPTEFVNGEAVGSILISNNDVEPAQSKEITVTFEIADASQVSDIVVDENYETAFGMSGKGYSVEVADKNAAPANQVVATAPIKLTLNGQNLPTNFTWSFPDYLCVDDASYVRILAYYDTGDNRQIDTEINTSSSVTFGANISGNLASPAPISQANSIYFLSDKWQYIYYDMTNSYGYTDSLSVELFGGKNASAYQSDDTLYIAEIALLNVDSSEAQVPVKRFEPTGIVLSSNEYEGQKGVISNLSNDTEVSTNGTDWVTVQRFAQSIGGTYSAGVLSGLDAGTYYFRYSALGDEFAASEPVSFVVEADKVFIEFYDANGELIAPEIADYSTTATDAFGAIVTTKDGFEFLGWSTTQDATEPEDIIPDANKSFYPVFKSINNVYVKADGTGDGLTDQTPTSDFAAAWDIVAVNGGTITVIGTVDAPADVLSATDKDIVITGDTLNIPSEMNFAQSTGKVTFNDIAFEGAGTINLNGKEAEFTYTVTGTYSVCASESADVTGKVKLAGGTPTVNVVGSVKVISSVAYVLDTANKLTDASVQTVTYTVADGCGVEFSGNAYKVTAQDKYAVVKYVDGKNVSLIENAGNVILEDGDYEVNFYATEAEIPVTINIYNGTEHLKTITKLLGETYSYTELGVNVTLPEGKVLKSFDGDGYTLNLTDANTLTEIPENANINLYAVFAFDAEKPYWYTVGEYNAIEHIYTVEVKLAYGGNQVSAGAVGLEFNVSGLTRTGDVVYDSAVENIEGMVYENAAADSYVIAFSTGANAPLTAVDTGVTIATMTFTLSPEDYAAMDDSAFSVYVPGSANLLYNGTDKWQIISGTEDGNIYAPKYVDSFIAPHETSVAQYEMAELELTVVLDGAADGRTVTENVAKFGYKPTAGGEYKYVDLEVSATEYGATEVYTISGIEDFVVGIAYDIIVVKNGYISAQPENVTVPAEGEVPEYTATLAIGDLTADANVDTADFNAIVAALNSTATAQAMGQADINEDGFVTVFDLAIVKDSYGKTASDSTITPTSLN